ncbi:MAG: hypothetical protein IKT25_09855, partial [Firmicutes bacterium]|nr:hypothetical protein [Bacillota bacterium]
ELGVTLRLVGEEPLSPVTAIYNEALQSRLPGKGIDVEVIPRKELGDAPISASRVRVLLVQLWERGLWIEGDSFEEPEQKELAELLPVTTYDYLCQTEFRSYLEKALEGGKR